MARFSKCELHIPFKDWSSYNTPDPHQERQNYLAIERWASNFYKNCGSSGGCPQSWAFASNSGYQGTWDAYETISLSSDATVIVTFTSDAPNLFTPYVDNQNVTGPISAGHLTYAVDLTSGSHDLGVSSITFDGEVVIVSWSMTMIATCSGTSNVTIGGA